MELIYKTAADKQRERQKAYRAKWRAAPLQAKPHVKRSKRINQNMLPFIACDGEGTGRGLNHEYKLFRIGDRELYRRGQRLTTPELLQFICDTPSNLCIVAFAFEYDITEICLDVPYTEDKPGQPSRLDRLLKKDRQGRAALGAPESRAGKSTYQGTGWTWVSFEGYPTFGLDYLPRNYLKVCIGEKDPKTGRWHSVHGSIRNIWDTFTNFQCSFLKALQQWEIGPEHWEEIARQKDARATFTRITKEIRDYCRIECELLAEMMEQFRAMCLQCGIVPKTWNGAGKLASSMLKKHGVMKRVEAEKILPQGLQKFASAAYFGGRFEVTRIGELPATDESDKISAYPAAMVNLPCLTCGKWHKASAGELRRALKKKNALFVAHVNFAHPDQGQFLCGFPIRSDKGRLYWPRYGHGIYWSCEIRSAIRLGADVTVNGGWLYEKRCDHKPFSFVVDYFEERRRIGKSARGYPIKLAINALGGKAMQRIGYAPYRNPVWTGLITATTRAALNDAIAAMPNATDVVMLATDGIYTVGRKPKLDYGEGLGQWEHKKFPGLFVVRPGLWWPMYTDEVKLKTRGISPKFFEPMVPAFEARWRNFALREYRLQPDLPIEVPWPLVPVPVELFIGLRLAHHRGKPELAGTWEQTERNISFSWMDKRETYAWIGARHIITMPRYGDPNVTSTVYDPEKGLGEMAAMLDLDRLELESMPEPVDLSPPYTL